MRRALVLLALLATACATTDPSKQRLETTPRHDEWVTIARGGRTLHAYVSYPESAEKAPAIVVIHENRGLTDWVRSVADRLAENGYIAIAPDMLSGMAPGGGKTNDFATSDAAREAISKLPPEQVLGDLQSAADSVLALPSANGKLSAAGFCWAAAGRGDSRTRVPPSPPRTFSTARARPTRRASRTSPRRSSASTAATTPA